MNAPEGRRVIHSFLARCGIYQTSFNENALQMARAEGRREVGLNLIRDLQAADHKLFAEMYIERIQQQSSDKDYEDGTEPTSR